MANIIITTHWTGGDVYPIINLGKELLKYGHKITLFSHCIYKQTAINYGMEFVAWDNLKEWKELEILISGAMDPIINRKDYLNFINNYLSTEKYRKEYKKLIPYLKHENTIIMGRHGSSIAAYLAAEKYNIPVISIILTPSYLNQIQLDDDAFKDIFVSPVNELRKEIGLKPVPDWTTWICSSNMHIALWPDWFHNVNQKWIKNIKAIGFPFLKDKENYNLPSDFIDFMKDGIKPVLISAGTSKTMPKTLYFESVKACEQLGIKAILASQHDEYVPENLPDHIKHFKFLDFNITMPYMKAIIYHGGMGTLNCAMCNGIPQIVLGYGVDRPLNGMLIEKLGVGFFLPFVLWKASYIKSRLCDLSSEKIINQCSSIKEKINSTEQGKDLQEIICRLLSNKSIIKQKDATLIKL